MYLYIICEITRVIQIGTGTKTTTTTTTTNDYYYYFRNGVTIIVTIEIAVRSRPAAPPRPILLGLVPADRGKRFSGVVNFMRTIPLQPFGPFPCDTNFVKFIRKTLVAHQTSLLSFPASKTSSIVRPLKHCSIVTPARRTIRFVPDRTAYDRSKL